jgi:hypothetical protein
MKGEDYNHSIFDIHGWGRSLIMVFGVAISPLWFFGLLSSVLAYNAEVSSETLHKGLL